MKRTAALAVLLSIICLLCCRCSFQPIQPVEELMHPPYDSDNNRDLLEAFHASVNGTAVFLPPACGAYTSAITVRDFDGDGEDEAVVFYKIKLNSESARMNVLDYKDGKWQSVADIKGSGAAVDSLRFAHMDNDNSSEPVVCWRVGTTAGRILSVFRRDEASSSYKELANEAYAVMTVADFDGDGFDDIFYIGQETTAGGNSNTATLMKMSADKGGEAQIVELDSARLDSNVVSYGVLQFSDSTAPAGTASLFVDAVKGEDSMITEVIRWNGHTGELEVPFLDAATMRNTATMRTPLIPSMDIDGDGLVEIPVQHPMLPAGAEQNPAKEGESAGTIPVTEWMEEKDGRLIRKQTTVINAGLSYIFTFNAEDIGSIFIREETENCWIFYRRNSGNGKMEDLYSVIPVAKTDWNEQNDERYTVLADCGDHYICAYISDAGNAAAINTGKLEEQFRVFAY